MFINIIIITIIIIIYCIVLPGVPKSDCRPVWRRRRFFISSVEDSVLERSAALESLCFGIGFGRLGSVLFFCITLLNNITYFIVICYCSIHALRRLTTVEDSGMVFTLWLSFGL